MSVTENMLHQSYSWMRLTQSVRLVLKADPEVCVASIQTLMLLQFLLCVLTIMIVSYLGLVFLVVTDVTKQKKYPHSSNANTIFTIRLITNVNVNTYSAS